MHNQRNQDVSAVVGVRLPEDKLDKLDEIARRQHNSRSGVIRQALDVLFEVMEGDEQGGKCPPPHKNKVETV